MRGDRGDTGAVDKKLLGAFKAAVAEVFGESDLAASSLAEGGEPGDCSAMALVGLSGDLKGFICLLLPPAALEAWTALMAGRYNVAAEGDSRKGFAASALGETANQVAGRFAMRAAEAGRECGITPPTVLSGKGVNIDLPRCGEEGWLAGTFPFGELTAYIGVR